MASSPASQSAGKGKQMSSRLLTMKFMQRASGSAPTSPSTPSGRNISGSSTPNSPLDDGPPSKRFKSSRLSDAQAVHNSSVSARHSDSVAGLGDKESPGQAGSTQFGNGVETKWAFAVRHDVVLPEAGFRVEVLDGRHSDVSEDEEPSGSRIEKSQGRKVFGRKKKQTPSQQDTANNEAPDDSSDSESSGDSLDRQARKILDAPEFRKADSPLVGRSNRISGGINLDRMQCHGCKGFGHMLRNCPNVGNKRQHQPIVIGQKG